MIREEGSMYGCQKQKQIYTISTKFDSDELQSHRVNDSIYYFHYCQAKTDGKDFQYGYFTVVYHLLTKIMELFFKVHKKIQNLREQGKDLFNCSGFRCKKLSLKKGVALSIECEGKNENAILLVKAEKEEIAKQLKHIIYHYQPNLDQQKCRSKQEIDNTNKMFSTKDSKNSNYDELKPCQTIQQIIRADRKITGNFQQKEKESDFTSIKLRLNSQQIINWTTKKESLKNQNSEYHNNHRSNHSQILHQQSLKIYNLQENLKQLRNQQNCLLGQNIKLEAQIEELKKQNEQYETKIKMLNTTIKQYQHKKQKQRGNNCDVKEVNAALEKERKKVIDLLDQNEKLTLMNSDLNKRMEEILARNKKLEQDIQQKNILIIKLGSQQRTNQGSYKQNCNKEIAIISKKLQEALKQLAQAKQQIINQQSLIKAATFDKIFSGELLQNYSTHRMFLISQLESYTNRTIVKTKFLYKYDALNKVNFHNYIDNLNNIVIVIRLSNGLYVAGFTESAFYPKVNANDAGLLISLTNQKVFYCQMDKKAITYDEYYIIFGNSELRIKVQDNKIFSNFGISNGFYSSNGFKVNILLGEDQQREVPFDGYEIYQVVLQ